MHLNDKVMEMVNGQSVEGMFEVRNRKGIRVRLNGLESWTKANKIRKSAERQLCWCAHETNEWNHLKQTIGGDTKEAMQRIQKELIDELFASGELTIHQIK